MCVDDCGCTYYEVKDICILILINICSRSNILFIVQFSCFKFSGRSSHKAFIAHDNSLEKLIKIVEEEVPVIFVEFIWRRREETGVESFNVV